MATVNEIRMDAISVINTIVTLKANVSNGCPTSRAKLVIEEPRLSAIKRWAIANNQIQEIRHYFAAHNFGQNNQFAAREVALFFNN